jgi:hypothetical protein
MNKARTVGYLGLLLASAGVVGCGKTFDVTVTNVSPTACEVRLSHPDGYWQDTVVSPGRKAHFKMKVDKDDLPGTAKLQAGTLSKTFGVDKQTSDELNFYIEEKQIVGPLGPKDAFRGSSKTTVEGTTVEQRPVITGDKPAPGPGEKQPGKVIIKQGEVVE